MENAADALKIAFGIFVFITAITLLFIMTAKTKDTADTMFFYTDKTNFYSHSESKDSDRVVSYSDVVSTIYKYYTEAIAVKVKLKNGNEYYFDSGYESTSEDGPKNLPSKKEKEEFLGECIKEFPKDSMYRESFTEEPITGSYITAVDGTQITLINGEKKVYITYTEQ